MENWLSGYISFKFKFVFSVLHKENTMMGYTSFFVEKLVSSKCKSSQGKVLMISMFLIHISIYVVGSQYLNVFGVLKKYTFSLKVNVTSLINNLDFNIKKL